MIGGVTEDQKGIHSSPFHEMDEKTGRSGGTAVKMTCNMDVLRVGTYVIGHVHLYDG